MNGYVESGYVVALVSLGGYAASIVTRQRGARRRLPVRVEAQRPGTQRPGTQRRGGEGRGGEGRGGGSGATR